MKDGLIFENDELIYYKHGEPYHAGVIQVDGDIYYISSRGRAVKGRHIVHRDMTNGILKRGTYTFGDDYKLVKGSYVAPKKHKKHKKQAQKKRGRITFADRLKVFFKNKKNRAAVIAVACFAVLLAFLPMLVEWNYSYVASNPNSTKANTESNVKVVLPTFEEDVLLCSRAAKMAYDGKMELKDAVESGDPYRPLYFEYHLENATGKLLLSEHEDLADALEYELAAEAKYVTIDNLKVDTTYYYEVRVEDQVYPGTFHTAAAPRFVTIPGLKNTRDIGGYVNRDGKKVK